MANTTAQEIFESFESTFQDKVTLPNELELIWLKKAVGRYSMELEPLSFDVDTLQFDTALDQYVIDTLGAFMKQSYMEREVSRINKQISIVGKDLSINTGGHNNVAARNELAYCDSKSSEMVANQKPPAYS